MGRGLWYHIYPSIFGVFLVFVSTIIAMSLSVSFSMDLRLVVLPVMPFALRIVF